MILTEQLRHITNTKDRLWQMNIDVNSSNTGIPDFYEYGGGYPDSMQHTGARFNYEVRDKWVYFYKNMYVLLQAFAGWDRRRHKYILSVENSSWNIAYNDKCFLNATIVQSIADLANMKQGMTEQGYTVVHEENNWFILAPSGGGNWKAHLLVMHRNADRNQLIDDALTFISGKLLELLKTILNNYDVAEEVTVEQLSVNEPELPFLSNWTSTLEKLEADEIAAREERKANAAKIAEGITEKFITKLREDATPVVKGKELPLHSVDIKDELERQIESLRLRIKEYTREITQTYMDIENKEREYMSILCGKTNDFANLIGVLDKMMANDSPLKFYNLIKGKLELFFVNPITYWEDDEIDQWHNTDAGKKWIDLITSKRFQVMTGCKVVVSNSVAGTSVSLEGNTMAYMIGDFVTNRIIEGGSEADEERMWDKVKNYYSHKVVALDPYRNHFVKQPHIARFSCFGNNEQAIIDAFKQNNYDLGMSIIVHCVTQLNLTDGTVVRTLFEFLEDADYTEYACIWDTETQQYYKPTEALDMFNSSKEVASNETN